MSAAPTERLIVCAAFEKGILQDSASCRTRPPRLTPLMSGARWCRQHRRTQPLSVSTGASWRAWRLWSGPMLNILAMTISPTYTRRRILLDLAVRSGATLGNLAAGQLHASLPAAEAFTEVHAFQVRNEIKGRAVRMVGRQGVAVETLRA